MSSSSSSTNDRLFNFVGGDKGEWRVQEMRSVSGESLAAVSHVAVVPGALPSQSGVWTMRGVTSNERYVTRDEKQALLEKQDALGRADFSCAALIPIKKNTAWWALSQDERRDIFEAQSQHIRIGLKFLPGIARRLHHCRDLGVNEAFDFITWFEYAPALSADFEALVDALRATPEWRYIDREIDIRLIRDTAYSA